jgi:uncharacterized small protein (DUF1192 family)
LGLLESDNDAEALQALRTAQGLLERSKMTIRGLMEVYLERPQVSSGFISAAELFPLQAELKRYRAALDVALDEKEHLEKEVQRLHAHLLSKDSLNLFLRLREREDNVTALTKEIRRLKDELFKKDHRVRELERTKRASGLSHRAAEAETLVRHWVELSGLIPSSDPRHWVSVRTLYAMFLGGLVSFEQEMPHRATDSPEQQALQRQVGQKQFLECLREIFRSDPVKGSRLDGAAKGFGVTPKISTEDSKAKAKAKAKRQHSA